MAYFGAIGIVKEVAVVSMVGHSNAGLRVERRGDQVRTFNQAAGSLKGKHRNASQTEAFLHYGHVCTR